MLLPAILLGLACGIAIFKPAWGLLSLIALEASIFNLGRFFTVSLPIGYAGPSDVLVLAIWWGGSRQRRLAQRARGGETSAHAATPAWVVNTLLPYVGWLSLCFLHGAVRTLGTPEWNLVVRASLAFILPWLLVPSVAALRRDRELILYGVSAVALFTSLAHLVIQAADIRSVMATAYWSYTGGTDAYAEYVLQTSDIVRGLPQGHMLMVFVAILAFAKAATAQRWTREGLWWSFVFLAQVAALAVTFSRSLMAGAVAGSIVGLGLLWTEGSKVRRFGVAAFIGLAIITASVWTAGDASSNASDLWSKRIGLAADDARILSADTIRGQDNLASLAAIADRPFFGWGSANYPSQYSLRAVDPTDIHPLLQLGIIAGLPGIGLALLMQWRLSVRALREAAQLRVPRDRTVPFVAVLITSLTVINLIGAGGTFSSRALIAYATLLGLLCAELEGHGARRVRGPRLRGQRL